MSTILKNITVRWSEKTWLLLVLTMSLALGLRILLLQMRWINPDEGAHLLDARLIWQGLVPIIDYASRQPVYTYLLALFVKVFGTGIAAGRLLPLFASLAIGWLIFVMVRRMYDAASGWLAASIYVLLPYTLIWSTVVKTEMPAVFFCCLSACLLLRAIDKPALWSFLLLSGCSAAMAVYIRQSTLYMPAATAAFIAIHGGWRSGRTWKQIGVYVGGFILVCLMVAWYYWGSLTASQIIFSQINPLNLVWNRLAHLLGILPEQMRIVDSTGFRILDQDMSYTWRAWQESLLFSLFIVSAAVYSAARLLSRSKNIQRHPAQLFLALWVAILLLAYAFQSANRGFYSQYFLESLPPLLMLGIPVIKGDHKGWPLLSRFIVFAGLFFFIFVVQRILWHQLWPLWGHLLLALFLAGLWAALAWMRSRCRTSLLSIVGLVTLFLTASVSGKMIGPKYECIWSPATLDRAVEILQGHGKRDDTVLSGAMIWTHASGLQPYGGVSHPTLFFMKYDAAFEKEFLDAPPGFIVVDGYTQKKFARYWDFIERMIAERYEKLVTLTNSKWPVEIYRLLVHPELPDASLASNFFMQRGASR